MIKSLFARRAFRGVMLALAAAAPWYVAQAHPYASGVTNKSGTVFFYLNENADSVKVVFDNGTSATNNLGALTKGQQSFALGAHTNYSIIVAKVGSGVPSQTSTTLTNFVNFFGPRGVAVNPNPKTANFGRVYVSNASPGTSGGRTVGKGLYAMNADQSDALGQGNTALTAGMSMGGSTTYSPWKLSVGPDDMLYVADGNGTYNNASPLGYGVWMVKPDLSGSTQLFPQASRANYQQSPADGVISKVIASGSYALNDLTLRFISWDWTNAPAGYNNVLEFDINGSALPYTTPGTVIEPPASGLVGVGPGVVYDMDVAPDGKIFVLQYSTGNGGSTSPLITVFSGPNGTILWDSWDNANPAGNGNVDPYNFEYSIAVSPDDRYMGSLITSEKIVVTPLTNGVPNYSSTGNYMPPNNVITPTGNSGTARQIAFDAADNVYEVSGGSDQMRVFSLGLTTTCITYNDTTGTNGTFQLIIPGTSVGVTAVTNVASQNGPTAGMFTLTRAGQNLNQPLTVAFTLGGTATNGVYTVSPGGITPATTNNITFAANQTTTNITITPVIDSIPRLATSVTLAINGGTGYAVGSPSSDTVTIINTNFPTLVITNLDAEMYERTNDYARFRVFRMGDTNADLPQVNLSYSGGTAVSGVNYSGPAFIDVPAGATSADFQVIPYHDGVVTGNLTAQANVAPATDSSYNVGGHSSASVLLVDSDDPTETVLWADYFTNDTHLNWNVLFASTNGAPVDYQVNDNLDDPTLGWPYDYYGNLLIPPAPHAINGDTHGIRLTVNKNDAVQVAAALNCYPIGQSFSGNFALRFDMFLMENTSSGTTEYALFGINHSGSKTNWFRNSTTGFAGVDPTTWSYDGIFYDVEADGAALGDYVGYSSPTTASRGPTPITPGVGASTLTGVFKAPPWTTGAGGGGAAANVFGTATPIWADVEVKQVNSVITWSINHTLIFAYTNATPYTSGDVMIGYEDGYDSLGGSGGSVIYANVRVISLQTPIIKSIGINGANAEVTFSANTGDTPAQFVLQSAPVVTGPYTDTSSSISSLGSGAFKSVKTAGASQQFYRVRRVY